MDFATDPSTDPAATLFARLAAAVAHLSSDERAARWAREGVNGYYAEAVGDATVYQAAVTVDGVPIRLGGYTSPADAAAVSDVARDALVTLGAAALSPDFVEECQRIAGVRPVGAERRAIVAERIDAVGGWEAARERAHRWRERIARNDARRRAATRRAAEVAV